MSAFPAMAGEWHKTAEDQYQYIKDDGTKATGLLELKDGTYYLDDKATVKPPTGCATKATGISSERMVRWPPTPGSITIMLVKTDRWIRCDKRK